MPDDLIARLSSLTAAGLLIAQDAGAGAFTPNGHHRDSSAMNVFGLADAQWCVEPAAFLYQGQELEVGDIGRTYFSHVRLVPAPGGQVLMPEVGQSGVGLIATSASALTFGFLPQIARHGPGQLFWQALFLDTLADFVRSRRRAGRLLN
jgi:hypothetical protein